MTEFIHGGDIYSYQKKYRRPVLDFSANISPLGLPQGVKNAIVHGLDDCSNYPDPFSRELRQALSEEESVDSEAIICGNGAADLIFRLVLAIKPKKAVVLAPTFGEYEGALATVSCEIVYHLLYEEEDFLLTDRILAKLEEDVDIVFLCNPNNPTGQLIEPSLLVRILKKCREKNIILAVDECFNSFLEDSQGNSMKKWLLTYPNLFILKAFTKVYAMAGIRLGYGLSYDGELIRKMNLCAQPWSVSHVAEVAGIQALKEKDYVTEVKALVSKEREYLKRELLSLDFKVFGSHGNYIFFKSPRENLKNQMEQKGILIRSCGNYRGLTENYFRVAVKNHRDNKVLIESLKSHS